MKYNTITLIKEETLVKFAKVCGAVTAIGMALTIIALIAESYILAGIIFSLPALFDLVLFSVTCLNEFDESEEE